VQKILDIWSSSVGVVSLHCFQNVIPVEAYTREACMVDAVGMSVAIFVPRVDIMDSVLTSNPAKFQNLNY
jgi:hypothetical protein